MSIRIGLRVQLYVAYPNVRGSGDDSSILGRYAVQCVLREDGNMSGGRIRSNPNRRGVRWLSVCVVISACAALGLGVAVASRAAGATAQPPITTVNRAAGQPIPSGKATLVTWDSERQDAPGWFTPTSPSVIRVGEAGVYQVTVETAWTANNTGYRSVHLQINGSPARILAGSVKPAKWETADSITWTGTLGANDSLSVFVYEDTGGSLNFGGFNRPSNASANAEFSVAKIG